uniref:protein-serine/threonine phosphatase n=1 Tax=Amblyomma aureolatum TaxID=187763 RepID=A0A1E1XBW1_9ACAR
MGAYLSEPVTEKFSTNETGSRISYGASSMQGWRMSQEDAHNTILNYDHDTSFFAVYDGHGGPEVAKYCAMKLPDFVKTLACYKEGNLEEALREGFLQFDASLVTPTGLSELKALAGTSSDDSGEVSPEEGEADLLHAEAKMPIEDLLARYSGKMKEACEKAKESGAAGAGDEQGSGSIDKPPKSPAVEKVVNGECSPQEESGQQKACAEVKAGGSGEADADGSASSSWGPAGTADEQPETGRRSRRNWKPYMALVADQDTSSDSSESAEDEEESEEDEEEGDEEEEGEEVEAEGEEAEGEEEEEGCGGWDKRLKHRLSQLNTLPTGDTETAGFDSGCTAVVGLLRGHRLVVANAGDSRCVVCRSGEARDMSLDHKPEDHEEYFRIVMAGGRVTKEGRVNGGLNLSRAIGDHAYKRNKDLDLRDQMITALPDVKTLDIDPVTDEFMVLACDGIWNNMTSQEVVDFVKRELDKGTRPLSLICEMLFDACLAPDTTGDGTGCDNMTCIIVQFHPDKDGESVANGNRGQKRPISAIDGDEPQQGGTAAVPKDDVEQTSKRRHIEDATAAAAVAATATASDIETTPNGAKATEMTDV